MEPLVLKYQLTFKETRHIYLGASPAKNIVFAFLATILTLIFVVAFAVNHEPAGVILFPIGLTLVLLRVFWIMPRRYWKRGLDIREPKTLTINDEGIVRRTDSVETKFDWAKFARTNETNDYFVLISKDRGWRIYLPKRGLQTIEDEARLRDLIRQKVSTPPKREFA